MYFFILYYCYFLLLRLSLNPKSKIAIFRQKYQISSKRILLFKFEEPNRSWPATMPKSKLLRNSTEQHITQSITERLKNFFNFFKN